MTRAELLMEAVERSGFGERGRIIHLFVGGSELHGAKVRDTDDLDIYGAYVEAPEWMIGLDRLEFHVWSTAGDDRRNGPEDIDVCLYSLRKWAGLAVKVNPTALHFLFAGNAVKDLDREGVAKDAKKILKRGDGPRTECSVDPHPSAENAERVGHPASGHPAETKDANKTLKRRELGEMIGNAEIMRRGDRGDEPRTEGSVHPHPSAENAEGGAPGGEDGARGHWIAMKDNQASRCTPATQLKRLTCSRCLAGWVKYPQAKKWRVIGDERRGENCP